MRARGQGALALLTTVSVLAGGVALQRLGPKTEAVAEAGLAPSGTWVCPHGGGSGWRTTIYVANPGAVASTVRITSLSGGNPHVLPLLTVPGGQERSVRVPSSSTGSTSTVEWFGGWVGAGWVSLAAGKVPAVSAEPCSTAANTWYAPDGSTVSGQDTTYLVIANPSAADAVFDVVLFAPDRPPIRDTRWTDLVLHGYRSLSLRINDLAKNESVVSAEVDVTSGRVALASIVTSKDGGVRSAVGQPSLGSRRLLPVGSGAGQTELVVASPGADEVHLDGTLLTGRQAQPAGSLQGASQAGRSVKTYPVIVDGPSAVDLRVGGSAVAAALRSEGRADTGATGGAAATAPAWVVLPTVGGQPVHPGLVVANPGTVSVGVTLQVLGDEGEVGPADLTLTVRPGSAVGVPAGFLQEVPDGAVVVRSDAGGVVALGASTSLGEGGGVAYALAIGIPIPG